MDEGSGTIVADTKSGQDGAFGADPPSWSGGSVLFDGVDDFINIPSGGLPGGNASLTMCATFKKTASGDGGIVQYSNSGSTRRRPSIWALTNTNLTFVVNGDDLSVTTSDYQDVDIFASWRYNAVTLELFGASATLGASGSKILGAAPDWSPSGALIGALADNFFPGLIYYISIHNRFLSDDELADHYTYVQGLMTARSITV